VDYRHLFSARSSRQKCFVVESDLEVGPCSDSLLSLVIDEFAERVVDLTEDVVNLGYLRETGHPFTMFLSNSEDFHSYGPLLSKFIPFDLVLQMLLSPFFNGPSYSFFRRCAINPFLSLSLTH
jgi:hypothetical protein